MPLTKKLSRRVSAKFKVKRSGEAEVQSTRDTQQDARQGFQAEEVPDGPIHRRTSWDSSRIDEFLFFLVE